MIFYIVTMVGFWTCFVHQIVGMTRGDSFYCVPEGASIPE